MALDPEEYKRRRAQREQQRQARQAQRKRTLIKLGIAAAVLIACGVLIIAVVRPGSHSGPGETAQQTTAGTSAPAQAADPTGTAPEETTAPQQTTEAAQKDSKTVIHIAAAGDLNINDTVVAAGGTHQDYTNTFMDVAHLLGRADITALNFEGVLTGAPYGSSMSAPQTLLTALKDAGVDLLQLANSYSIHKGMAGLTSTLSAVRSAGLEPMGAYASNQEFKASKGYTIREVRGVKVAFVAFTKGMTGMALPAGNENCVNVLYTDYATTYQDVDSEKILSIVNAAKKESPDIIVAMLHWGSEFNDTISTSQEDILELLQESGVDVILGTHSHYVQQMVFDPEAGTFVAYSLGDFLSDTQRPGTEYSVVLELEITKDNASGETKVTNYSYTPIFAVLEEGEPLRLMRIREAMAAYEANFVGKISDKVYSDMQYALGRIETRIKGE